VRVTDGIKQHFGSQEVVVNPPLVAIEPRSGTSIEIAIRNNSTAIQTFHLEAAGEGLEISPAKMDLSVGEMSERQVGFRVVGAEGATGVHEWHLSIKGAAELDVPIRAVLIPRNRTVAWSADLDGDGSPEWILESQTVRAVFSGQDGGRWLELTAKNTDTTLLTEQGAFHGTGKVEVEPAGDSLQFTGRTFKRTVRLNGNVLTVEQTTPLPADAPTAKKGLSVDRAETRATFTLQ
jgi:hypothetical protein